MERKALIMNYDTELTYDKLRNAAVLLQQNQRLPFLATHGDLVCQTEDGFVHQLRLHTDNARTDDGTTT